MGATDRTYSDEEFALILRKATELQLGSRGAPGGEGLRLGDIKQIAAESGIDPDIVEQAARLVATVDDPDKPSDSIQLTAWVDGEVPKEDLGRLRDAIRHALGAKGQGTVEEVLDSIEWRCEPSESPPQQVTVTGRDGRTRLDLYRSLANQAGVTYMIPMVLGFLAGILGAVAVARAGLLPTALSVLLGFAVGPLAGGLAGHWIFTRRYPKLKAEQEHALERLRREAEKLVAPAGRDARDRGRGPRRSRVTGSETDVRSTGR